MRTLTTLLLFSFLTLILCQDDPYYTDCSTLLFNCGSVTKIGYPFWGTNRPNFCGRQAFELDCRHDGDDDDSYPVMRIGAHEYHVLNISTETVPTIRIARADLWDTVCLQDLTNTTSDYTNFYDSASNRNLGLFYGCPRLDYSVPNNFTCEGRGLGYYADESLLRIRLPSTEGRTCGAGISVPVLTTALDELSVGGIGLQEALNRGFDLIYDSDRQRCSVCESSNGTCGSNSSSSSSPSEFLCLCRDGRYPELCLPSTPTSTSTPSPDEKSGLGKIAKLGIGFGAGIAVTLLVLGGFLAWLYLHRRRAKRAGSTLLFRNISSDPSSQHVVDFDLGVHQFSYCELEKATNNFDSSKELGDGGFGTVYYGKLKDGRAVAVKRLYEHNYKRVEQFQNEVEILTRLRHKNLVSLYGCTSRHSRELLLVYEYISNGTVADHLHGHRANPGSLPWPTRLKIAVDTADALSYLHASEIIHRDVKTNNILIDDHFSVKVADFGLSRLFPTDVTHVSTAPQGTPGYVDPDYHQCYQLTVKSDVYSFGVVLIELISSKPAVDITRHRHEINLANLAINKIQSKALGELVDPNLGFETDCEVRKGVEAVAELAFGCLQGDKDLRPSMVEVLEWLKRIQGEVCSGEKGVEAVVRSPDSVMMGWSTSNDSTPSTSV